MSYITFKNICKSYDNKTQVLKGIDLEVEEGELLTLLGPSGCGKSTLLRCLAGLEQVQQGTFYWKGGTSPTWCPPATDWHGCSSSTACSPT